MYRKLDSDNLIQEISFDRKTSNIKAKNYAIIKTNLDFIF